VKIFRPVAFRALLAAFVGLSLSAFAEPSAPLIFIPGYAASAPKRGDILYYAFHRGAEPTMLNLSVSYRALVRSLKHAGYVEGRTFFGAVFDWRMPAAPTDDRADGSLENLTAAEITSGAYDYAVNYLGYWLDQAVQANPGLEYVDVVTHSTGGILVRAYIQSPAYGAAYVDAYGVTRHLPKIRHLILGAAPCEGTVHTWRPWHGEFQDVLSGFIPTTEIEARFTALAFAYVSLGGSIPGPNSDITRADILQPDKKGRRIPDPTKFFRLYDPMRQSLMPMDAFLRDRDTAKRHTVNDRPALRSDVLLDLNAKSSPGRNPWVRRVGTASGAGGVIATYATGAKERTSVKDLFIPGLIDQNPFIKTLVEIVQLGPRDGDYLPLTKLLTEKNPQTVPVSTSRFFRIGDREVKRELGGDGNAPFTSYRSTFGGDPHVTIVQWGNGAPPAWVPADKVWTRETNYPVYHDAFFYNPDVRRFVVRTLTGETLPAEPVLTREERRLLEKFLNGDLLSSD
jgi:hypothetical protein